MFIFLIIMMFIVEMFFIGLSTIIIIADWFMTNQIIKNNDKTTVNYVLTLVNAMFDFIHS